MLDDVPPLTGLQADSELAAQIEQEIKNKLLTEYSYAGTEETMSSVLPEYIKVMVCNAKPRKQAVEDLTLFLNDAAPKFVDWLWGMLADRNPARTHSAFEKPQAAVDDDMQTDEQPKAEVRRRRDDGSFPSARGFRNALQSAARDARREDRGGERERERRTRTREYERDEGRERERRTRKEGEVSATRGRERRRERDGWEGERVRERDTDRHRRLDDELRKPRKQFNRLGEEEVPAPSVPAEPSGPIRFRITDSKGAGKFAEAIAAKLETSSALEAERERSLLSAPRTGTKFTITLDKIDPSEIPSISYYQDMPEEEQQQQQQAFDSYGAYGWGGKGFKGGSGKGGAGRGTAWTPGGNLTWTPSAGAQTQATKRPAAGATPQQQQQQQAQPGAQGQQAQPQQPPKNVTLRGGSGRGSSNMVWQSPAAAAANKTPAAAPQPADGGVQLGAAKPEQQQQQQQQQWQPAQPWWATAPKGQPNKTWVNPAHQKKEQAATSSQ